MRKHISKALQQRSQAIRTAIAQFNEAARSMIPERPQLTWEQVLDYAFLADFDLLRDSRGDVRVQPWANHTTRLYMDSWFKLERAAEEIRRLNIEIRRVVTHLHDEGRFLMAAELKVAHTNAPLAFQIQKYRLQRTRFADLHVRRFRNLAALPGFTGTLQVGSSIDRSLHVGVATFEPTEVSDTEPQISREVDEASLGELDEEEACSGDEDELEERFNIISALCRSD